MAITDLTNTKWVFNSGISFSVYGSFDINGSCFFDGQALTNFSTMHLNAGEPGEYPPSFVLDSNYIYISGWNGSFPFTLNITGGTDATNVNLISWLQANATQIIEPTANTYTITHTLTNVNKGNITLQLTPDAGYELPDTITVTNGTLVSYDKTTGIAVISGDDNTSVSVECVASAPSGYSVTITDSGNLCSVGIYDGINNSGTLLYNGFIGSGQTVVVSSGNLYIKPSLMIDYWGTNTTGGVTKVSGDNNGILFSVTGDGTITTATMD